MLFSHKKSSQTPPTVCSFSKCLMLCDLHGNKMSQINTWSILVRIRDNNWELRKDFLKTCHVRKHVLEREKNVSVHWMTRMVPDPTCTNKPILCKITSDSFFSNPLSPFSHGHLPLPWLEILSEPCTWCTWG